MKLAIAPQLPQIWQFRDLCFLYKPGHWGGTYVSAPYTIQVGTRELLCSTRLLPADPYFYSSPADVDDPDADEANEQLFHRDIAWDAAVSRSEEHREFFATYQVRRALAVYTAYLDKGPTPLTHDLLRQALCGLVVARMTGVHRGRAPADVDGRS